MIEQLITGNTPDPKLVFGRPNGIAQDMVAPWTCNSVILDSQRNMVVGPRTIAETVTNSDGVTAFKAEMLISESLQMINTFDRNRPAQYFWLITVENLALEYNDTLEIELAVRKR